MQEVISSNIMRTTIDIDDPILRQLKDLQRQEGKSLGRLVSDLLASALEAHARGREADSESFDWTVREMGARYDLSSTSDLLDLMDRDPKGRGR